MAAAYFLLNYSQKFTIAEEEPGALKTMSLNILLLCGGDGAEHEISLISAQFLLENLKQIPDFNVIYCCLHEGRFTLKDGSCIYFLPGGRINMHGESVKIDCAVPCLHGTPGETGEIQSFFRLNAIPYIGCNDDASLKCFNKITTKLYLTALGISNTPYTWLIDQSATSLREADAAFAVWNHDVYVKAAAQGSSIGCYHVKDKSDLHDSIAEAFTYADSVLIEKNIEHRELEVAAYETDEGLVITPPGEIIMPDSVFYTYEEKYSKDSGTVTTVEPEGLSDKVIEDIRAMARRAFIGLQLRDLSRIDFFLADTGEILLNEINTFPGMTPISMFPKLLAHHGDSMPAFLEGCIRRAIARGF